jgi:2-methylaconitate cis-trans-isomerase PrpF
MSEDDRRQSRRVSYFGEARLEGLDVGRSDVRIADLSADGAFVDARTVLPTGTIARLHFAIDSTDVSVLVEVRYSMPGFGMGVRFIDVDDATRRVLNSAIAQRAGS